MHIEYLSEPFYILLLLLLILLLLLLLLLLLKGLLFEVLPRAPKISGVGLGGSHTHLEWGGAWPAEEVLRKASHSHSSRQAKQGVLLEVGAA